jgi:hypothetical protein
MFKYFGRLAAILFFFAAASCFLTAALGSPDQRATRTIVGGVAAGLAGGILLFDVRTGEIQKVETKTVTSKYEKDNPTPGDFECQDEGSLTKNPEIDLYVAIKEKRQR